jgi:hypothetical protein
MALAPRLASPETAAQARQATDRLAAILLREEHSQDQELPSLTELQPHFVTKPRMAT